MFDQAHLSIKLEWEQFSILNEKLQKLDIERFSQSVNVNYSILVTISDVIICHRNLPEFMRSKLDNVVEILLVTKAHLGS